jgi:PleD family two-component response regulator
LKNSQLPCKVDNALAEINRTLEQKVTERTKDLKIANDDLKQLARRDALTGLSNR